MKNNSYDIVVIGAGSGGLNVASFFARTQLKVLIVDKKEESIGGDCLNTGCVPSKALIHAAQHAHATRREGEETNLALIMDEVKAKQDSIREHENSEYLRTKGMDVVLGEAHFTGENSVDIAGTTYTFKVCVLATGSRARELATQNDNSIRLFTNETIFTLRDLPKQFVFLGGGPISCELGQAFALLGSKVTIINQDVRILPRESEEGSMALTKRLEAMGVQIENNAKLEKIESGKVVYLIGTETKSIEASAIFVGIGRVLNTENLSLEKANIKQDEASKRLVVDSYLRTTNSKVYAVGDVAGSFMFTHAAEEHAKVVINNILSPFKKKKRETLAWVTYTSPQIATFGKSKSDLDKEGVTYEELTVSFEEEDRAITDSSTEGFVKVFVDEKGLLLGGTMVHNQAGELIQELILLYDNKLPLATLFNKVYPYPTLTRINKRLAALYMSKRLSDSNKSILRFLFKVFN